MTYAACRNAVFAVTLGLLPTAGHAQEKPTDKAVVLQVGDVAPTFRLKDDRGEDWSSADHVGKKWVVVYFYPGDFTPGCTAQARAFTAGMADLVKQGVEVVGVSGDSV